MKRKTMDTDVSSSFFGETSHRFDEVEGNEPILEPKHKIFLSHSGAQKEFVDHLCKALEDRFYYPFFDRRHESLPKGEQFSELIVQAIEQCEMLIVVVSDEYFMSKWPMIELNAFVQTHKLHHESKSSTKGPKIFPLFYGLSVDDLKNATMQKKWFQRWGSLAEADLRNRIDVEAWKYALDVLGSFTGLSYNASLKESVAYVKEIVSSVCKSILPEKRWDDSDVQGKSNICQVIDEKIERIGVSKKYKVKVVGLYGVGGIGKTTTCKILCNELLSKYDGRVCHIEFPNALPSDSKEFFQKVLRDLTSKHADVIQCLEEGECKDKLRKSLFKERTFLAIDNVFDNHESIDLAKKMLELPYHKDSLVVVTARSQSVLGLLGIKGDACLEMPDLGEADAMRLFLHHAASGQQFSEYEKDDIMTCVERCYFSKGDGQESHYHPLALRALGLQLGCCGETPSVWVKHLPRVRNFDSLPSKINPVFGILRSGFDLLSEADRTLFMELGFFCCMPNGIGHIDTELFYSIHMQDEEKMRDGLERLKQKGLLEDVDLKSGEVTMHDLYGEFAELEAKGSFNNSTSLRDRMWVFIEIGDLIELKRTPEGGCWDKLKRLLVGHLWWSDNDGQGAGRIGSLKGINWNYFSNVEVLSLSEVVCGERALNLKGLVCLRILELFAVKGIGGIEGLGELENLTHITWKLRFSDALPNVDGHFVGGLPMSLQELRIASNDEIAGNGVVLGWDLFTQCHNLLKLCLQGVQACSLDLSNCSSLESLSLSKIRELQFVSGLTAHQSSNLQCLEVEFCEDLVDIPGINHLTGLKKLRIGHCPKYQVPIPLANFIPCQLQELGLTWNQLSKGLNLPRFNQLEVLDLSFCDELISLAELGDLPSLQRLTLHHCKQLMRLPDLSKSRNLKELNLTGCFALQLHEKDIQMLCELPSLEPVTLTSSWITQQRFRLDLRRRKVLVHQSSMIWDFSSWEPSRAGEWAERDLGPSPIGIGESGPFSIGTESGTNSGLTELLLFR